jgi:hypothetical protein
MVEFSESAANYVLNNITDNEDGRIEGVSNIFLWISDWKDCILSGKASAGGCINNLFGEIPACVLSLEDGSVSETS